MGGAINWVACRVKVLLDYGPNRLQIAVRGTPKRRVLFAVFSAGKFNVDMPFGGSARPRPIGRRWTIPLDFFPWNSENY